MTKISLEKATGKTDVQWFALLDHAGAREWLHKDIARWLYEQGWIESGWWAQNVTVAYEKHIGRRVTGQEQDGTFTATVSDGR